MFAVCSSLRLARFNAASIAEPGAPPEPKPAYAYSFFQGVPAPAGAGAGDVSGLRLPGLRGMGLARSGGRVRHPLLSAVVLFVVGGLMVSTVPSWSFKNFKVPSQAVLPCCSGSAPFVAVLVTEPWAALPWPGSSTWACCLLGPLLRPPEARAEQIREPAADPA
jgi:CDP-diacylglycerol--serine O-phosphatidyltransferase